MVEAPQRASGGGGAEAASRGPDVARLTELVYELLREDLRRQRERRGGTMRWR